MLHKLFRKLRKDENPSCSPCSRENKTNLLQRIFRDKRDDSHEFRPILAEIEESPGNPLGRIIFWIILCAMIFSGLWMYFGKIDIVVSARGKVIPVGEIKVLQPLDTGVVSSILVKEGDLIKKGQALMEIDPSAVEPEMKSIEINLKHLELEIERSEAILNKKPFSPDSKVYDSRSIKIQRDIYSSLKNGLEKQLQAKRDEFKEVEEQIKSARTEKARNTSLFGVSTEKEKRLKQVLDIISIDEYEKVSNDLLNYENNIEALGYKLDELGYRKSQIIEGIAYIEEDFRTNILKELFEKQKQAIALKAELDKIAFRSVKQSIVSPIDGYVNNIFIHTIGGVVTPAQKLISIVPVDSPLIIKAVLNNKDMGFVEKGMPVSVKIDTFDFQKYGLIRGEVQHISKDSIENEKLGPVYEVYINMIDKHLMVDGKEMPLSSGMSLTAEIKVEKRRVIEFFIYPIIKYLDEGVSVR